MDDAAAFAAAGAFLDRWTSSTIKQRSRLTAKAPLPEIHAVALRHPDPSVRRWALFYLDHYANDTSMAVFAEALHDPVDFVRNMALHSLACESCKSEELCVADVVPGLVNVLQSDPNPDLRVKAVPLLLRLSASDPRAGAALQRAAQIDPDPAVRTTAAEALAGRVHLPRKRYQRQQRRHAQLG